MRRGKRFAVLSTFLSVFLLSSLVINTASAATSIYNPGSPLWDGYVQWKVRFTQDKYHDFADNIEFDLTVKEYQSNRPTIDGWIITVSDFASIQVLQPNNYKLEVQAYNGAVAYQGVVEGKIELWLSGPSRCDNQINLENMRWSKLSGFAFAVPGMGWLVDINVVRIINLDSTQSFVCNDIEYLVTPNYPSDITLAPFDTVVPGSFTLAPGNVETFTVALGGLTFGYVVFHYNMRNVTTGEIISQGWGCHGFGEPPPSAVGGAQIPVDKLDLLAPYIASAIAIMVFVAGTVLVKKRRFGTTAVPTS